MTSTKTFWPNNGLKDRIKTQNNMKSLQPLFLIIALVCSGMISAQDVDDAQQAQRNGDRGMEKILTPDQLALLQEQNELVKRQREAFKNSLSDDQLAILDNEDLNRRERREALRATFTQDQLDLLDTHKTNVQALKDSFRESLTDEQKQKLKKRRQRLKERKQQLNQKKRQVKKRIKKKKNTKN